MKHILINAAVFASSLLLFAGAASAATTYYVDPAGNDGNACTSTGASACATVQGAVNKAAAGDTIDVAAGTYSGNIIIPNGLNNLTIQSTGAVTFNLGSGYGVNLDNGYPVTGFTLNGFTFNSSSGTTYAFKAYHSNGLSLSNDIFDGNTFGGGVDINTTSNVMLSGVTAENFHKNGFAITSAYTVADQSNPSSNITFNNITSTGNGWTGISFYTVGNDHSPTSIGGSASMTNIQFTGTNTLSNNGTGGPTQGGIFIEGDSDANVGAGATPANTVTSNGTALDLDTVAFSGNSAFDLINYQSAPVTAYDETFGGLTGDQMSPSQQTTENGKIYDNLDNSHLGLVSYYHMPSVTTEAATSVTTSDATMNALNGPVAADSESFWVSTSTINTSSPNIPAGVYSTPVLSGIGAGASFQDQLSLVTTNGIVTGGNPGNMPAITPGTTYDYVAWVHANGTWYPGNQESVTIPLPDVTVTIDKFIDGQMATSGSAMGDSFPMTATWNATNIGSGSGSYSLGPTGFNSANAYEAVTAQMTQGASYSTSETTGGSVVGADCTTGQPYALAGYTTGSSLADAESATPSMTTPNFSNLQGNEYVIVWNKSCAAVTTEPATGLTASDATLNGLIGGNPASGHSFWVSTSPFSTASPTIPSGVYSTPDFGAIAANQAFSAQLSSLTTSGVPSHMPAVQPNTTYYFVAWAKLGSTWYPGAELNFATGAVTTANACMFGMAPAGYTLKNGTAGNPNVTLTPGTMYVGKNGNPNITGPAGNYILCLGKGNATVHLGDGTDTIQTGNGNENITTGTGNDSIATGNGNSSIRTGNGDNTVTTGNGNENITTGSGNDTITAGNGNSNITAGTGTNSCTVGKGKSVLTECNGTF